VKNCQPCERTLTEVATLLELLHAETLSTATQAQVAVVLSRLRLTGLYFIEMAIKKQRQTGHTTHRDS